MIIAKVFTFSVSHSLCHQGVEPHRPWGVDGHGESPMAGRGIGRAWHLGMC